MTVPRFYGGCHNKFIQKPAVYFGFPGGELSAQRTEGWLPTQGLRQHRTIPALRLKHRSGGCGTASALPKCSIRLQYYLRFWLGSCRTSLAVSALRIMRYCPKNNQNLRQAPGPVRFTPPYPTNLPFTPSFKLIPISNS